MPETHLPAPDAKSYAPLRRANIGRLPLTKRQAEIFDAVRLHGTHSEAARYLGISRQWVSRVIARCRMKGHSPEME